MIDKEPPEENEMTRCNFTFQECEDGRGGCEAQAFYAVGQSGGLVESFEGDGEPLVVCEEHRTALRQEDWSSRFPYDFVKLAEKVAA